VTEQTDIRGTQGGRQGEDPAVGAAREPLTRDRIVRAALRVMDEEGLDALSMRRIGREVGVEAMSLYNHVEDKEDMLEGVKELVMSEFEFGERTGDWEEDARRAARAWRHIMRAHPAVITLMTEGTKPMVSVDALRPSEVAFDVLHHAGLDDAETARAFCAFGGYIMGFVLMEVGALMSVEAAERAELARTLPADQLPRSCAVLPHLFSSDVDERFEYGLDLLLAGLRARLDGPASGGARETFVR
jgi:TetR/AcrR family tetracycline transcriptional repressor